MLKSLEELVNIIRDRKNSNPEKSYTSKLLNNKKNKSRSVSSFLITTLYIINW